MAGGGYADYAAWDSQDNAGGGPAYAFIEAQPQVSRDEQTLQPASPQKPIVRMQQPIDPQQLQQRAQVQTSNAYNGSLSSAQADADRQMLFMQMQEHMQMQQDGQRSGWLDRCWQRRRDVMKLVVMALVVVLALATHWVAAHYLKTYVESATLSEWRELFVRLAYPVVALLVVWAIKGAQWQSPMAALQPQGQTRSSSS